MLTYIEINDFSGPKIIANLHFVLHKVKERPHEGIPKDYNHYPT